MEKKIMIFILLFIVLVFQTLIIIFPLYRKKFPNTPKLMQKISLELINTSIITCALKMLNGKKTYMSFSDEQGIYTFLSKVKAIVVGEKKHHNYSYFNFPLAFMLNGLIDYYIKYQDQLILENIQIKCQTLVNKNGELNFSFDKIDQASFGVAFLKLYKLTNNEIYLNAADEIYKCIQAFKNEHGIYLYRKDLNIFFIDTIGLVCPFLVDYSRIKRDNSIMQEAELQLTFVIKNCTESNLGFPFHALDLNNNQRLGSVNWSRGMGWFLLGLTAIAKENTNLDFLNSLRKYTDLLYSIKEKHGFWSQFLGHTDDHGIDSSASLMFLYAFQYCGTTWVNADIIKDIAAQCVDVEGKVMHATGDTIYINKYSRSKGASELSQGLMLSILSGL